MKQICQREYHLFALSETNKLYVAGAHGEWRKKYDKLEPCPSDILPAEPIKEVKCNGKRIAILTESHKIYITERCRDDDAPEQARRDGWIFKHYKRPNEDTEKLLNWDIGEAALCYTTEDGKAYENPNIRRPSSSRDDDTKQLTFSEGIIPLTPNCSHNDDGADPLIMIVKNNDKTELWSKGRSSEGMLGQGNDKTESREFAPLDYDKENITFTKVQLFFNIALAVTDKGELYGWGYNEDRQLGMSDRSKFYSPTEIPFFKDYYVHDFSVGKRHALIKASPRTDMNVTKMFHTGRITGFNGLDANGDGIAHLKQFDNMNISCFEAGSFTSLINIAYDPNSYNAKSVHEGYTCEVTQQSPITGTMHFWKSVS